ncbi:pectinesterase family protein [Thermoflavifilum thermophilum]|uniref:Pectinesterase n=1 Tax=Thermoflavifilum thermophilum TaxID=1393122 RepID=A0A1I7N7U4_9BACT|nr:pectinesterase family protein [Thermoflavifilum thermophilum]SFV30725.1 pectinesterase [Thermoflavifilum thermophilum]
MISCCCVLNPANAQQALTANQKKYDYVVAQDGKGDFTSIQAAIEACKSFPYEPIRIFIKKGIYHEKVFIPEWNPKIALVGEDADSTIIVYDDYFKKINKGPNSTFYTPTVLVQGSDFYAENITFQNDAGPVGQAIALAVDADRCMFVHCRIIGNQDALYVTGEHNRQYFRDCTIEGTTDFIFGEATALFDSCTIVCKANSFITAASTPADAKYGLVFRDCQIQATAGVDKVYLGRPWRKYAKTVFIRCEMGGFIRPEGWDNWRNPDNEKTVFYAEYHSTGHGAKPADRVKWSHQLNAKQASIYTIKQIFTNPASSWNPFSQL